MLECIKGSTPKERSRKRMVLLPYIKYFIASMIDTVTVELGMLDINLCTTHATINKGTVENEDSALKSSDK